MPSFTSRHYTPDRFHSLSKDDVTDDAMPSPNPSLGRPSSKSGLSHHHGLYPSSLALVPSDGGSLLDYFDLPSPPSTPHRSTHHTHSTLSYSALSGFPSPASTRLPTPSLSSSRRSSMSSTASSFSPASSPPMSSPPRWPTAAQRISRLRPRSRSVSSTTSSSSSCSSSGMDVEMTGTDDTTEATGLGVGVLVRPARRTPYYPPNASRNTDRTRVYMNRGPHFVQNWTPMGSLPRHVQLRIEEGMVKFTA